MQIKLSAPKIWIADTPVDFRKAINGLSELVAEQFDGGLEDAIYVFYSKDRRKVKLLASHHNGMVLIYKRLDKKRFVFREDALSRYAVDAKQLSWLLAGLDWVEMSSFKSNTYQDYF